jgi:hypothetical protein
MWGLARAVLAIAGAVMLAACSADSHAPVPKLLRAEEAAPRQLDPEPDVNQLLRGKLDQVFTAASHPRHVQVSPPRRELNGPGWTVCIRAELTSITGRSLGTQTYLATIGGGIILNRRRVEASDNCSSETYEGIQPMRGGG